MTTVDAAGDFVTNVVPELVKEGRELGSDFANEKATDAITGSSLHGLAVGFGIGGQIGLVIGFAYTSMWAMRTGLLTRFWGSLGVALGIVSFLFFQFALLWFIYLGLLLPRLGPRRPSTGLAVGRSRALAEPGREGRREDGGRGRPLPTSPLLSSRHRMIAGRAKRPRAI